MKVSGDGIGAGQIQIQTLTSGGSTDRTFYWIPESEAGDYEMEGEGWYDADEGVVAEKTFTIGEGFVTMNDFGDGASITYSGAVPMGATEVVIASAVATAGNSTPVDVDIQSIVVTADGIGAGQVQIQTVTSGGATGRTFFWIPESEAGDYDMEGEGWYDADEGIIAEKTFVAGEGFVTMNDFGDGANLVLPSPL
ncbi:MAG: hypothetical protein K6F94_07235 [Bacteroidaceae bacterium]|nr:hypothetical protein [Bacteroidaceae bacterium]